MPFKHSVLLTFGLLTSSFLFAQQKVSGFFEPEAKVIWYGIDYTHAKYIGGMFSGAMPGLMEPGEFKNLVVPFLNGLVIKEHGKYNLEKTFSKAYIKIDTSLIAYINRGMDVKNFQTYDNIEHHIEKSKIQESLQNYPIPLVENTFGIIVFTETINKIENHTSYYVTVFDNSNKKELFSFYIDAPFHGGSVKPHSSFTILNMLEQIRKSEYRNLEKKYSDKK